MVDVSDVVDVADLLAELAASPPTTAPDSGSGADDGAPDGAPDGAATTSVTCRVTTPGEVGIPTTASGWNVAPEAAAAKGALEACGEVAASAPTAASTSAE
eukprot:516285-Prorocentrum_minimum.AAC.1